MEDMARVPSERRKQAGVSFKGWAITGEESLTDQSVHYRPKHSLLPLAGKAPDRATVQ